METHGRNRQFRYTYPLGKEASSFSDGGRGNGLALGACVDALESKEAASDRTQDRETGPPSPLDEQTIQKEHPVKGPWA